MNWSCLLVRLTVQYTVIRPAALRVWLPESIVKLTLNLRLWHPSGSRVPPRLSHILIRPNPFRSTRNGVRSHGERLSGPAESDLARYCSIAQYPPETRK